MLYTRSEVQELWLRKKQKPRKRIPAKSSTNTCARSAAVIARSPSLPASEERASISSARRTRVTLAAFVKSRSGKGGVSEMARTKKTSGKASKKDKYGSFDDLTEEAAEEANFPKDETVR